MSNVESPIEDKGQQAWIIYQNLIPILRIF